MAVLFVSRRIKQPQENSHLENKPANRRSGGDSCEDVYIKDAQGCWSGCNSQGVVRRGLSEEVAGGK